MGRFSEESFHKSEPSWPNSVSLTLNKTKMGHIRVRIWLGLGTLSKRLANANEPKIQSKCNFLFTGYSRFSTVYVLFLRLGKIWTLKWKCGTARLITAWRCFLWELTRFGWGQHIMPLTTRGRCDLLPIFLNVSSYNLF